MNLIINGEQKQVSSSTLKALLQELDIKEESVIIEYKGTLYKAPYDDLRLHENEPLEIIQFMGGG